MDSDRSLTAARAPFGRHSDLKQKAMIEQDGLPSINITDLRNRLNEKTFQDGVRRAFLERLSERYGDPIPLDEESTDEERERAAIRQRNIDDHLVLLRKSLATHRLELVRDVEDDDLVYAQQRLRATQEVDLAWLGKGIELAYSIMAAALMMVLPVLLGVWLDSELETNFLGMIGIAIGVIAGLASILSFARSGREKRGSG